MVIWQYLVFFRLVLICLWAFLNLFFESAATEFTFTPAFEDLESQAADNILNKEEQVDR